MFAIVKFGDKQHKVVVGEAFECERLNLLADSKVEIQDIVLISNDNSEAIIDNNSCSKYKVLCTVIKEYRDDKIIVFKKKRRQGYKRKRGHRQYRTILFVDNIVQK